MLRKELQRSCAQSELSQVSIHFWPFIVPSLLQARIEETQLIIRTASLGGVYHYSFIYHCSSLLQKNTIQYHDMVPSLCHPALTVMSRDLGI